MRYEAAPSRLPSLCDSVAHRMLSYDYDEDKADILITNRCHKTLSIALKYMTASRDVVLL